MGKAEIAIVGTKLRYEKFSITINGRVYQGILIEGVLETGDRLLVRDYHEK